MTLRKAFRIALATRFLILPFVTFFASIVVDVARFLFAANSAANSGNNELIPASRQNQFVPKGITDPDWSQFVIDDDGETYVLDK